MSTFALISTLVTAGAVFSLLSYRLLRLPSSIGTMLLALCAAAALMGLGHASPHLHASMAALVARIDFNQVVLHGMLAFLLFAGALHLEIASLWREKLPVLSLALGATALSTVLVALLFRTCLLAIGIHLSVLGALLFGALISPTDPIAVLDMLRRVGAPAWLETQLAGESLFNDGIGAVFFVALIGASTGGALPSPGRFALVLLLEAGGAVLLGIALGYLTNRLLCLVDSYRVEVFLTLALAMGGYALADALHLSAPLEVVAAGLLVGSHGRRTVMSPTTQKNVEKFWELIDDMMNVVLCLLLGLELLVMPIEKAFLLAGLLAIPAVLLARFASVSITVGALGLALRPGRSSIGVLTWGGLRGALAVALALALPQGLPDERNMLLVSTYMVVVFSMLVQGLTLTSLLRRLRLT